MRGWAVSYDDGEVISEWEFNKPFRYLPKQNNIKSVALFWSDDRYWIFPDKQYYFELKKMEIMIPSYTPEPAIVARSIGYYEGNKKITWTLNERTGEMLEPLIEEI